MSLHYNGAFVNGKEIHKFKTKYCSKSIMGRKCFKRLFSRQYKETGLNGYVYDFSVHYDATVADDILDIHN